MASESIPSQDPGLQIAIIYLDKANQAVLPTIRLTENGLYADPIKLKYHNDRLLDAISIASDLAEDQDPQAWVNIMKPGINYVRRRFRKHAQIDETAHLYSDKSEAARLIQAQLHVSALFRRANQRFDDIYLA